MIIRGKMKTKYSTGQTIKNKVFTPEPKTRYQK